MSEVFVSFFVFVVGLCLGSFLNVVVFRIDNLKSVLLSRSKCLSCKKELKFYDMIPVLSYLILRGKCRNCGEKISVQYLLVEGWFGICSLLLYLNFGIGFSLFFYLIVFFGLSVVAVYDYKNELIPEEFSWAVLLISIGGAFYAGGFGFLASIVGGLIFGGLVFLMYFLSKEKWMGEGDVKIAATSGILAGFPVVFVSMFGSFLLGSIFGIIFMIFKKKGMKDSLPFSPFIILSSFLSVLYGEKLYNWYMSSLYF